MAVIHATAAAASVQSALAVVEQAAHLSGASPYRKL
jgi:hypothetical protein